MALSRLWRRMTGLDRVVVAGLFLGALLSLGLVGRTAPGSRVVVEQGGRAIFTSPLDQDREVALTGPLGTTHLSIHDRGVRVLDSPCRNQVCIALGTIRRRGEMLACVPNGLLITIVGSAPAKTQTYDLLSH